MNCNDFNYGNYDNYGQGGSRDEGAYRQVEPFLQPDETVIWCARPAKGVPLGQMGFLGLFSVFFFGFAIFWTVIASRAGFMALFGLPFIAVGAYLMYNSFFGFNKRLKKTAYAITERRVLIITVTGRGTNCTAYLLSSLPCVNVTSVNGTVGTITFRNNYGYSYDYPHGHRRGYSYSAFDLTGAFYMIENVQSVYAVLTEQISDSGGKRS